MAGSKEFLQYSDIPLFQRDIRNQTSLNTFIYSIFRFVRVWWVPIETAAAVIRERDLIISEAD